jgi:YidC/Oxa1 family membrane protein insertase
MFHTLLYQPLFNLLIWLYNVIPGADLGFAIIGISLVIRLILWPFSRASLKSQKALQDLQPKLDALKEQYKDDKEGLAKAMMALYKEEKVNPMSSCLPLLIQLPILWALYSVMRDGMVASSLVNLYPFVANPGTINLNFLGFINLAEPHIFMAVIAGALQFVQTKMLMTSRPPVKIRKEPGVKDENMLTQMNQSMMYLMPVMTVVIGASLPGGLTLYWIIMNIFAIIQQALTFKKKKVPAVEVVKT